MTEHEARLILDVRISRFDHASDVNEALEVAKSTLEEIEQYRQIGTVEQVERLAKDRSTWQQEAQRQAAAAGELKIALAEKLDELTKRIADREETLRGIEDNLQYVSVEWQIKQLKAIKDWLEGLIDGKENEPVSNPDKLDDGWIPVEERLPEVQQDVLVSLRSLEVYSGFRSNIDGYFNVNSGELVSNENVLAWQPLPAPYRPKEATR